MVMPAVDAPTVVGAAGRFCGEDSSCCGAPAALEGAVDRRAADPEQVTDLGCAVLPGGDQADQMSFLQCVELGPPAAKRRLALATLIPRRSTRGVTHSALRLRGASGFF